MHPSRKDMEFLDEEQFPNFFPSVIKNDRFACTKYKFSILNWPTQYKMTLSKCLPNMKNVKKTRFQAFYLANDEKTCRQFQGGESADSLVYANVTASNPSQFPNFPCCLRCMPQLLGSCHVFRVSGGGVSGGVAGWVGVGWWGGVGLGGVGWENNVIGACRARPHIRDATLVYACVRSLALLSYPHVRHATPT